MDILRELATPESLAKADTMLQTPLRAKTNAANAKTLRKIPPGFNYPIAALQPPSIMAALDALLTQAHRCLAVLAIKTPLPDTLSSRDDYSSLSDPEVDFRARKQRATTELSNCLMSLAISGRLLWPGLAQRLDYYYMEVFYGPNGYKGWKPLNDDHSEPVRKFEFEKKWSNKALIDEIGVWPIPPNDPRRYQPTTMFSGAADPKLNPALYDPSSSEYPLKPPPRLRKRQKGWLRFGKATTAEPTTEKPRVEKSVMDLANGKPAWSDIEKPSDPDITETGDFAPSNEDGPGPTTGQLVRRTPPSSPDRLIALRDLDAQGLLKNSNISALPSRGRSDRHPAVHSQLSRL
ncbi:hypothetical protein IAR55_004727 [Kwoniella newhampshirensis]|uniref:Uncharacterized protein n=1 Tax=Kwoniella newhampshirensis TaxID=1651941 RepID=A0AAW0YWL4_9TREE